MKSQETKQTPTPTPTVDEQNKRRQATPIIAYAVDSLPMVDKEWYKKAREDLELVDEVIVPPKNANTFEVPRGCFFRIVSIEGSQVGDLNLWNSKDLQERFFSGKTRQLHASHLTTWDRLWSNMPYLRPIATITEDTLSWYGWDEDGASVHDVIGTRCDPYTHHMLSGKDYNNFCHSNLVRAVAKAKSVTVEESELLVHDVFNVFMCTGFSKETHQYFMKASPVRPGDYLEFYAEVDLFGALSACPGGDCGSSLNAEACFPLKVEIYRPKDYSHRNPVKENFPSSRYGGRHEG